MDKKYKNNMIISMEAQKKVFDKIQHAFLIKALEQVRTVGNIFQHNKGYVCQNYGQYLPKLIKNINKHH